MIKSPTLIAILVTLSVAAFYWVIKGLGVESTYQYFVTLLGYSIAYSIYVVAIPIIASLVTMAVRKTSKWPHDIFSKLTYLLLALFSTFLFWGLTASSYDYTANIESINVETEIKSISIGNQVWSAENLNVDRFQNGDAIPQVQDATEWSRLTTGAWCYYQNDEQNGTVYGKLYNWYAVNDSRGLAPKGWHIPSQQEWKELADNVGGIEKAGNSLKAKHSWNDPNPEVSNASGFTALAGGDRLSYGKFDWIGNASYWWTSDPKDGETAFAVGLFHSIENIVMPKSALPKTSGYYVRCVKSEKKQTQIDALGEIYTHSNPKFMIRFPKKWQVRKGVGKYGVVSADLESEGQVNIQVRALPTDKKSIYELYTRDEFINSYVESLRGSYLDLKLIKADKVKIDGIDAYSSQQAVKSMDKDGEVIFLMSTSVFYTSKQIYIITIAIDERKIDKSVVLSIINSFSTM